MGLHKQETMDVNSLYPSLPPPAEKEEPKEICDAHLTQIFRVPEIMLKSSVKGINHVIYHYDAKQAFNVLCAHYVLRTPTLRGHETLKVSGHNAVSSADDLIILPALRLLSVKKPVTLRMKWTKDGCKLMSLSHDWKSDVKNIDLTTAEFRGRIQCAVDLLIPLFVETLPHVELMKVSIALPNLKCMLISPGFTPYSACVTSSNVLSQSSEMIISMTQSSLIIQWWPLDVLQVGDALLPRDSFITHLSAAVMNGLQRNGVSSGVKNFHI